VSTGPLHAAPGAADPVIEAAATWIARLRAVEPAGRAAVQDAFDLWRRADPRHDAAAERLLRFVDRALDLAGAGIAIDASSPAAADPPLASPAAWRAAARAALDTRADPGAVAARRQRRRGSLLAAAAAAGTGTLFGWRLQSQRPAAVVLISAVGAHRASILEDGSRIELGSGAAVEVRFEPDARHVDLLRGDVLVRVAKASPARAFTVETPHARVRALGTRFLVREAEDATVVTMLESRAAVTGARRWFGVRPPEVIVDAGQRIRVSARGVERLADIDPESAEDAYSRRQLVVRGRPLPEVLDEISRYREGAIRFDRQALDDIRVSAVLPLDDPNGALHLLAASLPQLRVSFDASSQAVVVERDARR
jgi:transmembrane sensor